MGDAISLRASCYTDTGVELLRVFHQAQLNPFLPQPLQQYPLTLYWYLESGGVASFEIYADASVDPQNDGFGSFEFKMSHDPTDMLIDVNTVTPPQGFFVVPNYSSGHRRVRIWWFYYSELHQL